ncbi:MAG: [FeFe] hydrogenase H-cluster maturation GTPase HydF [Clostridiales bacterium]|jgi:[FeFe] hydrogenase H-cluster maturation GTPase HydF|nr:[FeFe] hydrogenase H-cluster maturation GTPase HydF [Eubacteriales bacterium]MDH7567580.1 [FeFe] hydrogenase H-cluster maturation GTPase HydF [Clostridiales bacterium]
MGMNETPRSERVHIAIFGRRNAGKSSLINALTGQEAALVSPVKGTTTDPVYKAMELLPIGPVVFIDTAGLDDEGELGELRKKKALEVLNKTDVAIVAFDCLLGISDFELDIVRRLKEKSIPVVGAANKIDGAEEAAGRCKEYEAMLGIKVCPVSALKGQGVEELKKTLMGMLPESEDKFTLLGGLVSPGDLVVLVVPIDKAAPKGRLILPQQQTIRDILESDAIAVVTKEHELRETLESLGKKPRLVITDSQVFLKVAADTPRDIPLTSFSILFARHKGGLPELLRGALAVERLKDGDRILVAEACTHHPQADDIARVKIPRWLRQKTGKRLHFDYASGASFPDNIGDYALVVHCGGCMLNRRAMVYRVGQAVDAGVPIVNYGVLIAYVQGILERAISCMPLAKTVWEEEVQAAQAGKDVKN